MRERRLLGLGVWRRVGAQVDKRPHLRILKPVQDGLSVQLFASLIWHGPMG